MTHSLRPSFYAGLLAAIGSMLLGQNGDDNPPPPPLKIWYGANNVWTETMPSGQALFLQVRSELGSDDTYTATWWDLCFYPYVVGDGAIIAKDNGLDFLVDQVRQPYPSAADLAGPHQMIVAGTENYPAWTLPESEFHSIVDRVFASNGTGNGASQWMVPSYRPSSEIPGSNYSPYDMTSWWNAEKKNTWPQFARTSESPDIISFDAILQAAVIGRSNGRLDISFMDSDLYKTLYPYFHIRTQAVGFRSHVEALASYPTSVAPTTNPPPQLPLFPSDLGLTIGTTGRYLTSGTRPAAGMKSQAPENYSVRQGQVAVMRFSGYVKGTKLFFRSSGPNPIVYQITPKIAAPGWIRFPTAGLPIGDNYELFRVENSLFAGDLIGGERAYLRINA